MRPTQKVSLIIAMLLASAVMLHAALPFLLWLPSASRDNGKDPKSPAFFPTIGNTATPSGPAATHTPTATPTPVWDVWEPADFNFVTPFGLGTPSLAGGSTSAFDIGYDMTPAHQYEYVEFTLVAGHSYNFTATINSVAVPGSTLTIEGRDTSNNPLIAPVTSLGGVGQSAQIGYTAGQTTILIRISASAGVGFTINYQDVTGATFTFTSSYTNTYTFTPTLTATPTATNTPTITMTFTPNSGCAPVPTPTAGPHGAMVWDFPNNTTADITYWYGVSGATPGITTGCDSGDGTTMLQFPWGPNAATVGCPTSATCGFSGCISGNLVAASGTVNPYAQLQFSLVLNAATSGQGFTGVDITPYCPNQGVTFSYSVPAAGLGTTYQIDMIIQSASADYDDYRYLFTPADSAWHTLTVYFPNVVTTAPKFAQAGWGAVTPWSMTQVGGIVFLPLPTTGVAHNYDLCIDNLTFASPPAPAPGSTPTPCTGDTVVFNGENATACGPSFPGAFAYDGVDSSSVVNPNPLVVTALGNTLGCGTPGSAACFSGSIGVTITGQPYPYVSTNFELVAGGEGLNHAGVAINTYAPVGQLKFAYKASGTPFQVQINLITMGVSDYCYYAFVFSPATTGTWTSVVVGLPGGLQPNVFAQPGWGVPEPWATEKLNVGAIQFDIVASDATNAPIPYNICVDDVVLE